MDLSFLEKNLFEKISAYEMGDLDTDETASLMQEIIDSKMIFNVPNSCQTMVLDLVQLGYVKCDHTEWIEWMNTAQCDRCGLFADEDDNE